MFVGFCLHCCLWSAKCLYSIRVAQRLQTSFVVGLVQYGHMNSSRNPWLFSHKWVKVWYFLAILCSKKFILNAWVELTSDVSGIFAWPNFLCSLLTGWQKKYSMHICKKISRHKYHKLNRRQLPNGKLPILLIMSQLFLLSWSMVMQLKNSPKPFIQKQHIGGCPVDVYRCPCGHPLWEKYKALCVRKFFIN